MKRHFEANFPRNLASQSQVLSWQTVKEQILTGGDFLLPHGSTDTTQAIDNSLRQPIDNPSYVIGKFSGFERHGNLPLLPVLL